MERLDRANSLTHLKARSSPEFGLTESELRLGGKVGDAVIALEPGYQVSLAAKAT